MVTLNDYQKQILKQKKGYLERNDMQGFFENIYPRERGSFASFFEHTVGIDIFKNMKVIPEQMFARTDDFEDLSIPEGVEEISGHAFYNSNVKRVVIPDSVKTIRPQAFYEASKLEEVIIGAGVTTIPSRCFEDCTSLKTVFLPDNVVNIQMDAFAGCPDELIIYGNRRDEDHQLNVKRAEIPFYKAHMKLKK